MVASISNRVPTDPVLFNVARAWMEECTHLQNVLHRTGLIDAEGSVTSADELTRRVSHVRARGEKIFKVITLPSIVMGVGSLIVASFNTQGASSKLFIPNVAIFTASLVAFFLSAPCVYKCERLTVFDRHYDALKALFGCFEGLKEMYSMVNMGFDGLSAVEKESVVQLHQLLCNYLISDNPHAQVPSFSFEIDSERAVGIGVAIGSSEQISASCVEEWRRGLEQCIEKARQLKMVDATGRVVPQAALRKFIVIKRGVERLEVLLRHSTMIGLMIFAIGFFGQMANNRTFSQGCMMSGVLLVLSSALGSLTALWSGVKKTDLLVRCAHLAMQFNQMNPFTADFALQQDQSRFQTILELLLRLNIAQRKPNPDYLKLVVVRYQS